MPRIWIYKDKMTGQPKGEATVTYDDAQTADSAIQWFNGKFADREVMYHIPHNFRTLKTCVESYFTSKITKYFKGLSSWHLFSNGLCFDCSTKALVQFRKNILIN